MNFLDDKKINEYANSCKSCEMSCGELYLYKHEIFLLQKILSKMAMDQGIQLSPVMDIQNYQGSDFDDVIQLRSVANLRQTISFPSIYREKYECGDSIISFIQLTPCDYVIVQFSNKNIKVINLENPSEIIVALSEYIHECNYEDNINLIISNTKRLEDLLVNIEIMTL